MGKQTKAILSISVQTVIKELNKALADEMLAAYQYWIGSKIVKGIYRKTVQDELAQHAQDELRHADMLVERIIQLGGTPLLDPKDWYKHTICGFKPPKDPDSIKLLKENLQGERCAIAVYNKLLKKLRGKDSLTYYMVGKILQDEVEHECDLEAILEDIELSE